MGWAELKSIIDKLKEISPSSFVEKLPESKTRKVVIDDGPTRLRFPKGPNGDYTFTGEQFYHLVFARPIKADLASDTDVWIECCDVDTLVTRHKKREQNHRVETKQKAEKKKKEKGIPVTPLPKYDPESYFCESGIRSKDGTFTQLFNAQSIAASKPLRNKLVTFCADMLTADPIIPIGRSVIMQHQAVGPQQFIKIHDQQFNVAFTLSAYKHPFGEADLQLGYWAYIYGTTTKLVTEDGRRQGRRPDIIEVRSIDSDVLGILCHVATVLDAEKTDEKKTQIYWSRGKVIKKDGKDHGNHPFIHINRLVEHMLMRKWSIPKLLIIAHTFGSDFAWKEDLCPNTSFNGAWAVIVKNMKDLDAILIPHQELVKRECKAVWQHLLWEPDEHLLEYMPHFFKGTQSRTPPADGKSVNYDVSKQVLEQFVWKFPRCKPGADVDKGCLNVFWAVQYHSFPFEVLELTRPSNYIEVEDKP